MIAFEIYWLRSNFIIFFGSQMNRVRTCVWFWCTYLPVYVVFVAVDVNDKISHHIWEEIEDERSQWNERETHVWR